MGLGGHLLWTPVLKSLHEISGRKPVICGTPALTDLLLFKLYDRASTLERDPIFINNPHLQFTKVQKKNFISQTIDRYFWKILRMFRMKRLYEKGVRALLSLRHAAWVPLDMEILSYAKSATFKRMTWEKGGHIMDILARKLRVPSAIHRCEVFFTETEQAAFQIKKKDLGLADKLIVMEPHSNQEWFGDLRAWPFDRWQNLAARLSEVYGSQFEVAQIGLPGNPVLPHAKNLCGKLSFRETMLLMKEASLFIGQEGGLMHAANAVGVPSVIVWGGVTLPEFAGYPEFHSIICKYVECAPCGLLKNCPHSKKCLTSIGLDEVLAKVKENL